jgi:hypothetical protein
MKGILKCSIDNKWIVEYQDQISKNCIQTKKLPIHPIDMDLYFNRNAPDFIYKENDEVEFYITPTDSGSYASIVHSPEVFLDVKAQQYNQLIQQESWNDIYDEYQKDEYPAFGGPFTHAMTFIEWLKLNYYTPTRK